MFRHLMGGSHGYIFVRKDKKKLFDDFVIKNYKIMMINDLPISNQVCLPTYTPSGCMSICNTTLRKCDHGTLQYNAFVNFMLSWSSTLYFQNPMPHRQDPSARPQLHHLPLGPPPEHRP